MGMTRASFFLIALCVLASCDQATWITELPADLEGGIYELSDEGVVMIGHNGVDTFLVNNNYHISLQDIFVISYEMEEPGMYGMRVQTVPDAVDKISELSGRNIGKPLVFALDNIVYLTPIVSQEINDKIIYLNFYDDHISADFLSALKGEKKPAFDTYNHDTYDESLEILSTDTTGVSRKH